MAVEFQKPLCGDCGVELDESPINASDRKKPCPKCASTRRTLRISINETIEVHDMMKMKVREKGKKPHLEQVSGDDFHRDSKTWRIILRVVDRKNDQYFERILDLKTGKVIKECSEPLSKHINHGTAKRKKESPNSEKT